jgi:hypothetical protein
MRRSEWVANSRNVARGELDGDAGDELEGAHAVATGVAQAGEELHRGAWVADRGKGCRKSAQFRKELQARCGDDAKGAFRAEEQRLDVIAGVVLAQRPERGEDASIGKRHLQSQHELAHHSVTHHVDAAGVGGEVAAQLTGSLRAETQGKEALRLVRGPLDVREHAAGFGDHRVIARVEAADAVQA